MMTDDTDALDMIDWLYQKARQDALSDPGYLMEMITAMNKQREYRRVVEDE